MRSKICAGFYIMHIFQNNNLIACIFTFAIMPKYHHFSSGHILNPAKIALCAILKSIQGGFLLSIISASAAKQSPICFSDEISIPLILRILYIESRLCSIKRTVIHFILILYYIRSNYPYKASCNHRKLSSR